MQSLSVDDQTAALNWLETCPFATSDDTASVGVRVESFCVAESRWPDKDGAHSLARPGTCHSYWEGPLSSFWSCCQQA